jgi:dienelactone hydrolase
MIQTIEVDVAGQAFSAWLALPSRPRGAVVVCHGGGGLGAHERRQLERLAGLGVAALAPDLFGEPLVDRERAVAMIRGLVSDPARLRARVGAALRVVVERAGVSATRSAAIGHCFGGTAVLELARSGAEVAAVIAFHGGLAAPVPAAAGTVRARVLACCGADDPFAPREQRAAFADEMTRAQADWQLHVYGGAQHGFSVPDGPSRPGCAYHEAADRRSWRAAVGMLDEAFAAGDP